MQVLAGHEGRCEPGGESEDSQQNEQRNPLRHDRLALPDCWSVRTVRAATYGSRVNTALRRHGTK